MNLDEPYTGSNHIMWAMGGMAVGYIVGAASYDKMFLARLASRAIDVAIDLKWFAKSFFPASAQAQAQAQAPAPKAKWIHTDDHYKTYELNGVEYITFNFTYVPVMHFNDAEIDNIRVLHHDGSYVKPSKSLTDAITKCAGHGCAFKSGVPTLTQLKHLHSIPRTELNQVKKIIVNTTDMEEHIIH